jgi:hypothetical protein
MYISASYCWAKVIFLSFYKNRRATPRAEKGCWILLFEIYAPVFSEQYSRRDNIKKVSNCTARHVLRVEHRTSLHEKNAPLRLANRRHPLLETLCPSVRLFYFNCEEGVGWQLWYGGNLVGEENGSLHRSSSFGEQFSVRCSDVCHAGPKELLRDSISHQ